MAMKTRTHMELGAHGSRAPVAGPRQRPRPSQNVLKVQQLRVLAALPQAVQSEVKVGFNHLLP